MSIFSHLKKIPFNLIAELLPFSIQNLAHLQQDLIPSILIGSMSDRPEIKQSLRGSEGKNIPWYEQDLESLEEPARRLLETYSHIPFDQVIPHILAVRDHA